MSSEQRSLPHSSPTAYGFVGAGAITAAMVEGLSATALDPPAVFLSPRSRSVGRELASRFSNVQVCDSNQDVLERATSIVVAVRPQVAPAVLAGLSFDPEHVVISVMAGVPLKDMHRWTSPAGDIVRAIPLPSAARAQSLTVLFPDHALVRELFDRLGGVFVPSNESTFDALSAATATFAAHLDYLATIASWLVDHGVDHDDANVYVAHTFGQLGEILLQRTESLAVLTNKHMTPGGINEQFMGDLRGDGVQDVVRAALERILTRLRERSHASGP